MSTSEYDVLPIVKDRVLVRLLTMFSIGAVGIVALFLIQGLRGGFLQQRAWLPATAALMIIPLRLAHGWLGHRRSAALLVAYLLLVPGYLALFRGLTPGSALTHTAVLLLSGLFFGTRAVVFSFVACLAFLAAGSYLITQGLVTPWNAQFWDPQNPLVWARYGVILLWWGGGIAIAFVELVRHLEQGSARLRATLFREREERTQREAAQHALERSKRLEALAQLAGGMAHDFNNDLMLVMSSAELIEADREASPFIKRQADNILRTAETSAHTVRRLLTLGRPEPVQAEPIRVRELLRTCEQSIKRLLSSDVRLQVELADDGMVVADAGRMHQSLLNLALNARDAMPQGGLLVLRAERRRVLRFPAGVSPTESEFLCISCNDTGIGMDEFTQRRVFEPFFTTKAQSHGSGLGLAVVQSTVRDAQGFIELDSKLGKGTAIRLFLPAVTELRSASARGHELGAAS